MGLLQSLFQDVAQNVVQQGEQLERVELNLNDAEDTTSAARRELAIAEERHRKQTKVYSCLMILTVICLLFIIYFFWDLLEPNYWAPAAKGVSAARDEVLELFLTVFDSVRSPTPTDRPLPDLADPENSILWS